MLMLKNEEINNIFSLLDFSIYIKLLIQIKLPFDIKKTKYEFILK